VCKHITRLCGGLWNELGGTRWAGVRELGISGDSVWGPVLCALPHRGSGGGVGPTPQSVSSTPPTLLGQCISSASRGAVKRRSGSGRHLAPWFPLPTTTNAGFPSEAPNNKPGKENSGVRKTISSWSIVTGNGRRERRSRLDAKGTDRRMMNGFSPLGAAGGSRAVLFSSFSVSGV
jgi:hypothetical protein